jgi:multiple sugar transport system permease protein
MQTETRQQTLVQPRWHTLLARIRRPERRVPVLTMIAGIIATAIMLFPLYWMVVSSLKTNQEIFQIPATWIPTPLTITPYVVAFETQGFHLLTSLIIAIGTVIVSLAIAAPTAYALAHFRFRITLLVVFCLLLTQMIPTVTLATPMFLIFNRFGLLNRYIGLILADSTYAVPFDILILRAFLQAIPYQLAEAAFVDGAGEWGAFLRVIAPLAVPGIITAGLFAFLFAWGDFLYALTLITTNTFAPISLSIYTFLGEYSSQWNILMATATLASIPAAILLVAFQGYITAGLTSGAMKE